MAQTGDCLARPAKTQPAYGFSNPVPIVGDRTVMHITRQLRLRCRRCHSP
jgi:hypothetical protein